MVHVVDADEQLIFAFDHNPPVPTTQWKPGQTIEYTDTVFIPIYPYVGEASIQLGLHSTQNQKRLPLAGEDVGQRAYKVARIQLQPQTENVFTVFKEGWHPAEVAELVISDDKTDVPAVINTSSKDPRELGVLVFHAFIDPR